MDQSELAVLATLARVTKRFSAVRGMARIGVLLALVALIVVVWVLVSAHVASAKLKEQTEAQAIITVTTIKPKSSADAAVLILPGNVQANNDAPMYARTSGYLKHRYVDIGARVKSGQVLADIDAPEIDQQLRQAQADAANAEANLKIANISAERWRHLRETDSVSKQEADEKISLAAASAAQLQSAQANVQRLREMTAFKQVIAPFTGVVTVRNADVGQLIAAGGGTGTELFRIADIRQLRLYVHVPQNYAAQMRPDLKAEVIFPDRPGTTYQAQLERASDAIDTSSRTLLAQLSVDNAKNELLPGAYAEVHFQLAVTGAAALLEVPSNALIDRGNGLQVATVDAQGHVVLKQVTISRDLGSTLLIASGVDANDDIIINPPDSLTVQTAVRVVGPEDRPVAGL